MFALAGCIQREGLIEMTMGTTVDDQVDTLCLGLLSYSGKAALSTGGGLPSGD